MKSSIPALFTAALGMACTAASAQTLPGTKAWEGRGDAASAMVAGMHRFADRELAESVERRQAHWKRDLSSPEAYAASVAANRARFIERIGAVGERVKPVELSYISGPESPAKLAESEKVAVYAVRWSVYPGVDAEGLLVEPKGEIKANVIALPDCDVTPEEFTGVASRPLPPDELWPHRLAMVGCRVLVPALIDRSDEFSGNPTVRFTNQPHREWVYRQSYETGRHIIGYEVDKVRAAVDWFTRAGQPKLPVAVAGSCEGGLIAFYAAAADPRIDEAYVANYFDRREFVWQEPIYRNVWGLLEEFGDAEIASLITPRILIVANDPPRGEPSRLAPTVNGPPTPRSGRAGASSGGIRSPQPAVVAAELARWKRLVGSLAGVSEGAVLAELQQTGATIDRPFGDVAPRIDPRERMRRQIQQLSDYTQALLRTSELRRYAYWSKADTSSPESWARSIEPYRKTFHAELIGEFPKASEPLEARTVKLFDEPSWIGYGVELPVWPDVVASGILLLPKDLKPGEKRPVVVCQHGLEGRPEDVVDPKTKSVYHSYGAELADRGYIVYAPQNPYIGGDNFRRLQRKFNPLKRSLFSVIIRQHERTLEWLSTLPQVDRDRIAFYGLSYGGKTAMRVPAVLTQYCLSICSADFNEWVVKNTNLERSYSYMFTQEYDMYEFGLAERFNYAEMAALIAPRPFQVERGHKDGVAPDEWIGYEFAKVKRTFDTLGLADRVDITYFNAGHQIEGTGTFPFLARHLNWPRGAK